MSIIGVHLPYSMEPVSAVTVDETSALSYYPFVQGGPVEAGHMVLAGVEIAIYVNTRYLDFDDAMYNPRATGLFEAGGLGMAGGLIKGDALLVRSAGDDEYEHSVPQEMVDLLVRAGAEG